MIRVISGLLNDELDVPGFPAAPSYSLQCARVRFGLLAVVPSVQRWKWVSGSWVKWVAIFRWVTWVMALIGNCQ